MELAENAFLSKRGSESRTYCGGAAEASVVIHLRDRVMRSGEGGSLGALSTQLGMRTELRERVRAFRARRQSESESASTTTRWRLELRERVRAFQARKFLEGPLH